VERLGRSLFFLVSLALLGPGANAGPTERAQKEIRTALQSWTAAFNAGDVRHVCDLFSRDLIAQYQGQPERDYQLQCDLLTNSLKDKKKSYRYSPHIQEILVAGDLAVVRLVWTLESASEDGRQRQIIEEPGIDIFRKQVGGRWKISRYIAYAASHQHLRW
jgi:ketosteroid isomerase-like protein